MELTKISKEYKWEMGHRLPNHSGACKNIHGHSYRMLIMLEGTIKDDGMLIDFYDLDKVIKPLIKDLDHAFMCNNEDAELLDFLKKTGSKMYLTNYLSTVENISGNLCKIIGDNIKRMPECGNIIKLAVRVYETDDAYAESSLELK